MDSARSSQGHAAAGLVKDTLQKLLESPIFRAWLDRLGEVAPDCKAECEVETDENGEMTVVFRLPAKLFLDTRRCQG